MIHYFYGVHHRNNEIMYHVLCTTRHDVGVSFSPTSHKVQAANDDAPTEAVDVPVGHDTHDPRFR